MRFSWVSGWLTITGVITGLLGLVPGATGEEFVPHAHQLDLTVDNFSGFVARTSQVHVRENTLTGSRFHLASALGLRRMDQGRAEPTPRRARLLMVACCS